MALADRYGIAIVSLAARALTATRVEPDAAGGPPTRTPWSFGTARAPLRPLPYDPLFLDYIPHRPSAESKGVVSALAVHWSHRYARSWARCRSFCRTPFPPPPTRRSRHACLAWPSGYSDQTPAADPDPDRPDRLDLSREHNESGYLLLPWPVEPFGTPVVATTTLRERPEPYRLLVELARGKLNQLRTQSAEWQAIGLRTGPRLRPRA